MNQKKQTIASHGWWRRFHYLLLKFFLPARLLQSKYHTFRALLDADRQAADLLSELDTYLLGEVPADIWRIRTVVERLDAATATMVNRLLDMNPTAHSRLPRRFAVISAEVASRLRPSPLSVDPPAILSLAAAHTQPQLAGGKATGLSRAGRCGVTVPPGFVITTNATHRFIAANGLAEAMISRFRLLDSADGTDINQISVELQQLIKQATVPAELAREIAAATATLAPASRFAVRSSALAEDSEMAFAGQYLSELEVPAAEVISAYKTVLAGKYCPSALTYRLRCGLSDDETTMAVLVIPMLSPRVSGVMHTLDPTGAGAEMGIYAVPGLAADLVGGKQTAERYQLCRQTGVDSSHNTRKNADLLKPDELRRLHQLGLRLERGLGSPQEIEWALDASGVTILQSRPLGLQPPPTQESASLAPHDTPLYSGLDRAAPGIGCGPVHFATTSRDMDQLPDGVVVVTPTLQPAHARFLERMAGVVAENSSGACHFASVAREKGVPVVVGQNLALSAGAIVTIDGSSGRIFSGCVGVTGQEKARLRAAERFKEKFKPLRSCTTHLGLTAVEEATFSAKRCRSLHDLVRFCHEMSVREMFALGDQRGRGLRHRARKIATTLPLVMYVVELDHDALPPGSIRAEDLASRPMRSFWRGLADPRIPWDQNLPHLDWDHFDRISAGIFSLDSPVLASYAITTNDYLHLDIRFGYHFSIVDALCSSTPGTNYLNFRFKGGGGTLAQQGFRLEFIDRVLTAHGFTTTSDNSTLDASYPRASAERTATALTRLGRLLAATRLMDIRLASTAEAVAAAERFLTDSGD
ncbi:MAG: PEP/pyruvate-binding domain-containing protein [Desulfopila sp.]